jgi:hypothetical protein
MKTFWHLYCSIRLVDSKQSLYIIWIWEECELDMSLTTAACTITGRCEDMLWSYERNGKWTDFIVHIPKSKHHSLQ